MLRVVPAQIHGFIVRDSVDSMTFRPTDLLSKRNRTVSGLYADSALATVDPAYVLPAMAYFYIVPPVRILAAICLNDPWSLQAFKQAVAGKFRLIRWAMS